MRDFGAVDRIEGNFIVVEISSTEKMVNISKDKFKFNVEEGDILNLELTYDNNNNIINIVVLGKNEKEKERRDKIIQEKLKRLTSM